MITLIIIVNYHSAAMTLEAVSTARQSAALGQVQTVIVDNSEDAAEEAALRSSLPEKITLLVNDTNIGFGEACNKVIERHPSDMILLLNPDARLLPGCLRRLQSTLLENPRVAAVSPQLYWDDGQRFILPPPYPPVLIALDSLRMRLPFATAINRIVSMLWRSKAIRVWKSQQPVTMSNLSGAVTLIRRTAIDELRQFFDRRFFLYFEDTDLFLRLRRKGYRLVLDPRARAIHHYDQCARDQWRMKRHYMTASKAVFLRKHFCRWLPLLEPEQMRFMDKRTFRPHHVLAPDHPSSFTVEIPDSIGEHWLFEWSPQPDFIPSVGYFGCEPVLRFPRECWAMLCPGRYYGRLSKATKWLVKSFQFSWIVPES